VVNKQFEQYKDFEIVEKINEGDTRLYEILIRRHNSSLYKIGRIYPYSHQDTEDLMQDTYISAFYSLSKFENRSSFKTWLTRIMLNNCFQKKRKFSFKNETAVENIQLEKTNLMFQQPVSTEKTIINKELGHVLENALSKIPDDYRMVFTLRELNGLSTIETTEALNITETNVKVRFNRAKKLLRSEIEKMYSPDDIFEFNLVYCNAMVAAVMQKIIIKTK
jgi:RNA polymerase sigma-70 factor (ECF subfamily)